ncbi:MAG: error-prone DNA polymerase [Candidatus Korobacteraceae bacterium]
MYIELHARSAFSFLEGASLPELLMARGAQLEMPAMALLDRNGLYGAPRFHMAALRAGTQAHIGAEIAVRDAGERARPPQWLPHRIPPEPVRWPLLAETQTGYQNLCRLITRFKLREPHKAEGCALLADVAEFSHGLICLTGGDEGPLASALARGGYNEALHEVERLMHIFGPHHVFVELQRHYDRAEEHRNQAAVRIARALKLPLLATNGVHYATACEREVLDVLTTIRHHCTLETAGRLLAPNAERYLRSPRQMQQLFRDLPEAIANTRELSARLAYQMSDLGYRFPAYPVPDGETMQSFLEKRTAEGIRNRYLPKHDAKLFARAQQQAQRELTLIAKLELAGYFLIVWDIVQFCLREGILVQGRGSAANSVVCYALGITAVDPVGMDLLFERFLSEERGEWPDIDLDLPSGPQRERAIQYVYQRYGELGAAMTANVITYRGRSAAREAGKALGFDAATLDRLTKLVSAWEWKDKNDSPGRDVQVAGQAAGLDLHHPRIARYVELCQRMQDLPRHLGQHSGGMVICAGQLDAVVPIEPASMPGRSVIQWDKEDCADMKIIKVDLLGLGMMAALKECLELVPAHYGEPLDLAQLPPNDPLTYRALQQADTVGMFQVESRAQMAALPRNHPTCFYDLVVQVAIIRPGPIAGNMMNPYMKRRRGREPVTYSHPLLEPVLKRTLGIPLFQEQLIRMAMIVASFTGGEAEELRRAVGMRRSMARMKELEGKLRRGMSANHIAPKVQDEIVQSISSFALYGFPESHAASFALIAYASAYIKFHYLAAFTCALLNHQPMGFYSPATLVKDAQRHGLRVLPIDVCRSDWACTLERLHPSECHPERSEGPQHGTNLHCRPKGFSISETGGGCPTFAADFAAKVGKQNEGAPYLPSFGRCGTNGARCGANAFALRLGLNYARGLRHDAAAALLAARQQRPFTSIQDLAQRVPELRKSDLTLLAKIGALNSLGAVTGGPFKPSSGLSGVVDLERVANIYPPANVANTRATHRRDALWQVEYAGRPAGPLLNEMTPESAESPLQQMTIEERLVADFSGTGVTVGKHPMAFHRAELKQMGISAASELARLPHGLTTRIAGAVIARQRPGTAKGFVFLSLEDETGIANAILTPAVYEQFKHTVIYEKFLLLEGELQNQENVVSLKARTIRPLGISHAEVRSHDFH